MPPLVERVPCPATIARRRAPLSHASRHSLTHAGYRVPWDLFPHLVLVAVVAAAPVGAGAVCIAGWWCSRRHPQWRQQPAVLQLSSSLLRLLVVLLRPLLLLQVPPHL